MNELVKILAKIELFSGENMRQTPFNTGYRPLFDFMKEKTKISGRIDLIDTDTFYPGMTGIVQVSFIKGMIKIDHFKMGETFTFGEGNSPLGKGEIMELLS